MKHEVVIQMDDVMYKEWKALTGRTKMSDTDLFIHMMSLAQVGLRVEMKKLKKDVFF